MTKKRNLIFYPLITAVYPILFLYVQNIESLYFSRIIFSLFSALVISLILWFLLNRLFFRHLIKSAIFAALINLLFFSAASIYSIATKIKIGNKLASDYFIIYYLLLIAILVIVFYFLIRSQKSLLNLNRIFNAATGFLLIILLSQMALASLDFQKKDQDLRQIKNLAQIQIQKSKIQNPPDIYYLILDGYGRADRLKEIYDYDNQPFLDFLKKQGFYIADKSNTNYLQTGLSLSSSLNLSYLDNLKKPIGDDRRALNRYIENNAVFNLLNDFDYQTISFATGYSLTDIESADHWLKPKFYLDEFSVLAYNFLLPPWQNSFIGLKNSSSPDQSFDLYQERIKFIFDQIKNLPKDNQPRLVFLHLTLPHPPFVFKENGELKPSNGKKFDTGDGNYFTRLEPAKIEEYKNGYREQLTYLNQEMTEVITKLKTEKKAIIVLQADHGPGAHLDWDNLEKTNLGERAGILNSYYFPDQKYQALYPEISPVNSFRVILNQFFQTNLPLEKDKTFFSSWDNPYNFIEITGKVRE